MTDAATIERLLGELVAEVRGLRADLAAARGARRAADAALPAGLVAAIAAAAADREFTAAEIVRHAALDAPLMAALRAADMTLPRRLGKALHRAEGSDLDGWRIERLGEEREGVIWRMRVSKPAQTRKPAKAVAAGAPTRVSRLAGN